MKLGSLGDAMASRGLSSRSKSSSGLVNVIVPVVLEEGWHSAGPGSVTPLFGSFALHPRVTRLVAPDEAMNVQRSSEREQDTLRCGSGPRGFRAGHRP